MRRIIIFSPSRVWVEGSKEYMTLEQLFARQWAKDGTLLIGVMPSEVGRVLATERTLDSAVTQQYPGENSYSTLALETNVFQVYVAPEEMLNRLRKLGPDVRLVPYPAAVVASAAREGRQRSLVERTQIFLGTKGSQPAEEDRREVVVIDTFGEEFLLTAIRAREVLSVRFAQGEIATELQRTLAGASMEAPTIVCQDEQTCLELQSIGFTVESQEMRGGLAGLECLKRVESQRFLNQFEVAQRRQAASRRRAGAYLGVAALACLVAGSIWAYYAHLGSQAASLRGQLEASKQEEMAKVFELYRERYGTTARAESQHVRDELFDLLTILPPQVAMLSVTKSALGLSAVVERRPQAAPFSQDDLRVALRASTYFRAADITEEYDGHLVRYAVKVNPPMPPTSVGSASSPPPP